MFGKRSGFLTAKAITTHTYRNKTGCASSSIYKAFFSSIFSRMEGYEGRSRS